MGRREETFAVNGCRATGTGRRDSLAVNMVRTVARNKHAGHIRHGSLLRHDETVFVSGDFTVKNFRIRHMADGNKNTGNGQDFFLARL